jgi:hypothetical protein
MFVGLKWEEMSQDFDWVQPLDLEKKEKRLDYKLEKMSMERVWDLN